MDLFSGDLLLGNATLPNLMLKPGNHSTPVEGILDLQKLIKNIKTVIKDQASSLKNGNLELKTIGRSVYFEGVHVPYYSKVMQGLTLTANVPVGGLLSNTVQGVLGNDNNPFANLTLSEPASSGDSGDSKGSGLLGALGGMKKMARDMKLDKRGVDYLAEKLAELEE